MSNNPNQKRQPPGTKDGGQYAPDMNAESTVDLGDIGDFVSDTPVLRMELVDSLPTEDEIAGIESVADRVAAIKDEIAPKSKPAPKSDPAWDVELNEMDGFIHVFVKAPDSEDAVRQACLLKEAPISCVTSVTQRDESLGKLRHQEIWPRGETLRRQRGHEFVKASMLEDIPDLYSNENIPLAEQTVHAHYFSSNGDWYISEIDKDEGLAFGHCDLGMGFPEFGFVSLIELEETRGRFGVAVERDMHFQPKTFGELGLVKSRHGFPRIGND